LQKDIQVKSKWLNADESDILENFQEAKTSTALLQLIGSNNE